MMSETSNLEVTNEDDGDLPGSEAEPGSHERSLRLKAAVRAAGGNTRVAQRAGIPLGTLNSYLRGRDMKAGQLIRLAEATGVSLEWLATGAGSMRAGELPATPAPPAAAPPRLFGQVKIDRLVQAYEGAMASTRGADKRLTMHLTVVLYDQLTQAAEAAEMAENRASSPDA
jgi:hypothetical protein